MVVCRNWLQWCLSVHMLWAVGEDKKCLQLLEDLPSVGSVCVFTYHTGMRISHRSWFMCLTYSHTVPHTVYPELWSSCVQISTICLDVWQYTDGRMQNCSQVENAWAGSSIRETGFPYSTGTQMCFLVIVLPIWIQVTGTFSLWTQAALPLRQRTNLASSAEISSSDGPKHDICTDLTSLNHWRGGACGDTQAGRNGMTCSTEREKYPYSEVMKDWFTCGI